ncbi:cytochrome P450 [Micromonospora sp. FIMYZ51]|uniref:cytochrome P450 n=1 Tax=Micromonospora sp. FIMYZ51 TaxID=3051832 RepID=UPI00311D2FF2
MATPLTPLPPRFDGTDPEVIRDPYPSYARLRAIGPVCRFGAQQYGVTRYADVSALLRDSRLRKYAISEDYYRLAARGGTASAFFARMDIARGSAELRRALTQAVSRSTVAGLAPTVDRLIDELLEPLLDGGGEAVADLAQPLAHAVLCALVGVPAADRAAVRERVSVLSVFGDAVMLGRADHAPADAALSWLREHVASLLAERARRPADDLLTRLAALATTEEIRNQAIDQVLTLLYAGSDTTANLIATGISALAERPDEFARLRAAPALATPAVEEFLRFDAPIQVTTRVADHPVTIGDRSIRAGRILVLMLGSANRDPQRFAEPDRIDIGRTPNPHVSFGGGGFYCFGAPLARAQAVAVFDALSRRCAALEPRAPAQRAAQFNFRAFRTVPVTCVPA